MLGEMAERLNLLDRRIRDYDLKVESIFSHDERCQRLGRVEGVGPLAATALVAAVGNAHEFRNGRDSALGSAWYRVNIRPVAAMCS
jgi:transposase